MDSLLDYLLGCLFVRTEGGLWLPTRDPADWLLLVSWARWCRQADQRVS